MKKKICLFLGLFLLLVSGTFGFEILNSNGDVQEYFSLTDNLIKVVSTVQVANVSVEYEVSGIQKVKIFPFSTCLEGYCASFTLSSLTESSGGSFSGSSIFNIIVLGESKLLHIDLQNPTMVLDRIELNASTQNVEFEFNFSDNSDKITQAKLYKKDGSSEIFIADVLELTSYSYQIDESGDYIFLFKVEDEAGNLEEFEYNLSVGDIFEPIINSVYVVLKDSKYEVEFDIEDDINLSKYEIVQGNLIITEDIDGSSFEKVLSVPFNTGDVIFRVYDENENVVEKTIYLKSLISNTFYSKFSDEKVFKFKSNANECILTNVDSSTFNSKFSESSDVFSYTLDISRVQEYSIEFYCTKDNFKEYYFQEFYYDTNKPSDFEFEAVANEDGYVSLTWDESFDKESLVEYRVFRDDDEVYDGSRLKFDDKGAIYPETYSYYVEAYDEAGNSVETSEIKVIPKKVKVDLITTLLTSKTVQDSNYGFEIVTDENSKVVVTLKSAGVVVDSNIYDKTTQEKLLFNFNLKPGVNQVLVEIVDEVGNEFMNTYFVTYDDSLVQASVEDVKEQIIVIPVVEEPVNVIEPLSVSEPIVEKSSYGWIWFIFILFILGIFVKVFIIDEDKLTFLKNQTRSKSKVKKFPLLSVERVKDYNLEKDFDRIKKERIKKQLESKRDAERSKSLEKRGRTDFERAKIDDLSERRDVIIPFRKREVVKKKVQRVKPIVNHENDLNPISKDIQEKKKRFFLKEKPVVKRDEFSEYLQRVKSNPSWESTHDYIDKPIPIALDKKKEEAKLVNLNSLKEQDILAQEKLKKNGFGFFRRKEGNDMKKVEVVDTQVELISSHKRERIELDNYLDKRMKNRKSKNSYFAEKSVDRDIKERD